MTDREALAALLACHVDCNTVREGFCSCDVQHSGGHWAHLTELLTAEFLIVPRPDIHGYEYGTRYPDGVVFGGQLRERVVKFAGHPAIEPVERPILPWTPIPEGSESE